MAAYWLILPSKSTLPCQKKFTISKFAILYFSTGPYVQVLVTKQSWYYFVAVDEISMTTKLKLGAWMNKWLHADIT